MQRRSFIKASFAGLGSILLPRCGGDSGSGPDSDPDPDPTPDTTVEALFAADDHTVTNLDLRLRTSNRLDPDSIDDDAIYLTDIGSGSRISGKVSYADIDSEKGELRFYEPDLGESGHLAFDTTYRLQVGPDIRDENGKPLSGTTTFSFITRHSTKVSGFDYTIDAQGDLYAAIALTHGLKEDSVNETTVALTEKETGTPVAGDALYNQARNEISIKLPEDFDVTKQHTVTLDGVLDFEGVPLDGDGNETAGGVYTNDFDVAPYVTGIGPSDGSQNVARGSSIYAILSEDVSFKKNGAETTDLEGILTVKNMLTNEEVNPKDQNLDYIVDNGEFKLQFTPDSALEPNTPYTATVHSDYVFDVNGNRMRNDRSWNFTTTSVSDPAPGPITGLSGKKGSNPGQIELSWTTPEDFDADGNPVSSELSYNLWYKEGAAYTQTEIANLSKNSAKATNVAGGMEAGAPDNYLLTGLNPAAKHYIVMEAEDTSGNSSERIQIEDGVVSKGYTVTFQSRELDDGYPGARLNADDITIYNDSTGEEVSTVKTDQQGDVTIELPVKDIYTLWSKNGYVNRQRQPETISDGDEVLETRIPNSYPMDHIDNACRWGTDPNLYRWANSPKIVISTNTEKTNGITPDYQSAKNVIDDIVAALRDATDTNLNPGGLNPSVVIKHRPYAEGNVDVNDGELWIQFEDGLGQPGFRGPVINKLEG